MNSKITNEFLGKSFAENKPRNNITAFDLIKRNMLNSF